MMSVEKILKGELIGRNTKATHLKDGCVVEGKIIDESKNMLTIDTKKGRKKLVKEAYAFEFPYGEKKIRIAGTHFKKRPEDRMKTRLRKHG